MANCQTAFRVLKTPFEKIFTSVLIKSLNFNGTYSGKDFQAYTGMEPQTFKERIIDEFDFIQKYMIESIRNNKEIEQRMNAKNLQIQECKVQEVKALDASLVFSESSGIDFGKEIKAAHLGMKAAGQGLNAAKEAIIGMIQKSDLPMTQNQWLSNTTPVSSDMCNNEFENDQNANDHEDERVVLANLIANLKLYIDENKKIQKKLRNANASLTHELNKCKSALEESKAFKIDAEVHFITKKLRLRSTKHI
nr:hypothetical protein [Tanacetum cinerariifolium]